MDSILRKGLFLVTLTGAIGVFQLRHMLLISRIIKLCQEWELSRC